MRVRHAGRLALLIKVADGGVSVPVLATRPGSARTALPRQGPVVAEEGATPVRSD